jgi:ribosomal protein S18 acetylase RimI-like enzyme
MDPVSVRRGEVDDLAQIREVFRRSSLSNAADRPHLLAHPDALELDADGVLGGRTRVAVAGGRIAGFATTSLGDGAAELDDLFVDPDAMRQGLGTALVRDAAAMAHRAGATRLEVTANEDARAFYESVGFVEVGRAETRFGTAPRMHLDLSGHSVGGDDIDESS